MSIGFNKHKNKDSIPFFVNCKEKFIPKRRNKKHGLSKADPEYPYKLKLLLLQQRHNKRYKYSDCIDLQKVKDIVNSNCIYCGSHDRIGIDRIDSSVGYTKDNVQPCCKLCNTMKFIYSESMFLSHVKKIYNHKWLSDHI